MIIYSEREIQMEPIKIMPCLDMKTAGVVKGVLLILKRRAIRWKMPLYQAEGADELAMLDIAATPGKPQDTFGMGQKGRSRAQHSIDSRWRNSLD